MRLKVEKGIPIPDRAGEGELSGVTNTLGKIKVGESFMWPVALRRNNLYLFARRLGIQITIRKLNARHCRVWRVK